MTKRLSFIITLLGTIFFTLAQPIYAQQGSSIGYAQKDSLKYINLEPGSSLDGVFTVWNLREDTTTFYIYISGFDQVEDYPGTSIPLTPAEDDKDPYSASSWISTDIDHIDLVPNKNIDINFSISVPEDVALGEYHGKIFLSTMNPEDDYNEEDLTVAYSNLATGPDFLIQIGDPELLTEDLDLLKFTSDKAFYEMPPVTLLTEIENTGNTHVTPKGDIVIYNFLGKEVARFPLNPKEISTLRGQVAKYQTKWETNRQILTTENEIMFGPMKAELISTYKTVNPGYYPILSETSFWIIPWKILLAIIAAVILISIGLKVRKNGNKKRNAKKAE